MNPSHEIQTKFAEIKTFENVLRKTRFSEKDLTNRKTGFDICWEENSTDDARPFSMRESYRLMNSDLVKICCVALAQ